MSSSDQRQKHKLKLKGHEKQKDSAGREQQRKAVKVLDAEGRDVTPWPLCPPFPGVLPLDEIFYGKGSDHSKPTSSITDLLTSSSLPESTSQSSLFPEDVWLEKTTNSPTLQDVNPSLPVPHKVPVEEEVQENMLDEVVQKVITDRDTLSLLDLSHTHGVSEDAEDSEAVQERNALYADLCSNRTGNDKYVDGTTQTLNGMLKVKQIQTEKITLVDKGMTATNWDRYDSYCEQKKTEARKADIQDLTGSTRKRRDRTVESISGDTGSTVSSLLEKCEHSFKAQPDLEDILMSDLFKSSLMVMERAVMMNVHQAELAAYKNLPVLEDPDRTAKPRFGKQSDEDEERSSTPTMKHLWVFVCDLTKGYKATSMAWCKTNSNILTVGYVAHDSKNPNPGLVCCWSLKNPKWPECVYSCHSGVMSLDFSTNNPSQLAVGMKDGFISIYSVNIEGKAAFIASSRECSRKHLHPVTQITWTKHQLKQSEKEKDFLVSVSVDGRIIKWFLDGSVLDCIDLMKVKKVCVPKKHPGGKEMKDKAFIASIPVYCFDFHPTEHGIYLIGTCDNLIHECSVSNKEQYLDTYKHHFGSVDHVEWSPFSPDVFLSCSSDWTMHLWQRGVSAPTMSFRSIFSEVYSAQWSSNSPALFAALYRPRVEVWDLNLNTKFPTIVHQAAAGVELTSLLLAKDSDSVLVGDSEGQVRVYKLPNLRVGRTKEVKSLDDIIQSVSSQSCPVS
ncbi:dynein intermediate chain 4, axonemal-like [Kryptolebias marmoratus]|uniref:dynein intermediate chain 4, axonemal-like n=1 Tax=Kryptolebias marmoratus TaxID=37003 RepID=UPI000D53024D|nr:dynein intermediate chain 4, axonemal-like [Kryptolebias marmoratus]XP_024859223.1 dynein intermediate chain 4, axonemal-like [Kryptolebias marmoratus]XP_024859224.1 dynein intermediate chain 4, axonemal-like [Kryptolebias marmoratus]